MIDYKGKIIFEIICIVILISIVYWFLTAEDREKPDMNAMRAYRISILSDENIRSMKKEARLESERRKKLNEETEIKNEQEKAELINKCSDEVFRLRNEWKCNPKPLPFADIRVPSNDEVSVFESMLINVCIYAQTVSQAKEMNCLPK